jgi:hypothetical protein
MLVLAGILPCTAAYRKSSSGAAGWTSRPGKLTCRPRLSRREVAGHGRLDVHGWLPAQGWYHEQTAVTSSWPTVLESNLGCRKNPCNPRRGGVQLGGGFVYLPGRLYCSATTNPSHTVLRQGGDHDLAGWMRTPFRNDASHRLERPQFLQQGGLRDAKGFAGVGMIAVGHLLPHKACNAAVSRRPEACSSGAGRHRAPWVRPATLAKQAWKGEIRGSGAVESQRARCPACHLCRELGQRHKNARTQGSVRFAGQRAFLGQSDASGRARKCAGLGRDGEYTPSRPSPAYAALMSLSPPPLSVINFT